MLIKIKAAITAVANLMTICFNGYLGRGDRTLGDITQFVLNSCLRKLYDETTTVIMVILLIDIGSHDDVY